MKFSAKLDAYRSGIFTELAKRRAALTARGVDVIDLGVGTPDMPPEPHVMRALAEAASIPENYVYAIADRASLRAAAAAWYQRRFGVTLDPANEIVALLGSQDGLAHVALALIDPGDVVIVPDPGYPIFQMGPYLAGAKLYRAPQTERNGWVVDLDAIPPDVARAAVMMVTAYPSNPVTALAPDGYYEKLVAFAKRYEIAVIHDNAYCELIFDGAHGGSFLSTPGAIDVGIELNSLSKTYNMPGCRAGFALGNSEIIARLSAVKSHLDYGMFLPIQLAAQAALNGPQDCVARTRLAYQRRRDALSQSFTAAGWPIAPTRATMFTWARLPGGRRDSLNFALELMEKTGVIVVPGISFGEGGEGYARIAMVRDEPTIREAARRFSGAVL